MIENAGEGVLSNEEVAAQGQNLVYVISLTYPHICVGLFQSLSDTNEYILKESLEVKQQQPRSLL
jgi:hypothetical protein